MKKPSRAQTLLEVLVAMSIFSIASLALLRITVFGMQTFRESDKSGDSQRALLKVSQQLKMTLGSSLASSASWTQSNATDLAFTAASIRNNEGKVELEDALQVPHISQRLFFYRNPAKRQLVLWSRPENLNFSAATALSPAQLATALTPLPGEMILAQCKSFSVLEPSSGLPAQPNCNPVMFVLKVQGGNQHDIDFRTVVKLL
jgi:type II secretory pathway pseudopilin PulG